MGVFVVHLGVFMILSHLRLPPPAPPAPTFKVRSHMVVDHATGEKTIYREITVSTRLGTPAPAPLPSAGLERLLKAPEPPPADGALDATAAVGDPPKAP
jgi:hypothetical protein